MVTTELGSLKIDIDRAVAALKAAWGPADRHYHGKYGDHVCWYRDSTGAALMLPFEGVDERRSIAINERQADWCQPY